MNVLLLQLDGKLPNLALMRIAAHHRAGGDRVEVRRAPTRLLFDPEWDRVYASTIFVSSARILNRARQEFGDRLVFGGTGIDILGTLDQLGIGDGPIDYSDYPDFTASIGFTQRGCRLRCDFCVVPQKEGRVREVASIWDVWRGEPWPRHLHLLDNDFFGQPSWQKRVDEMRTGGFKVCLTQGINARFLNDESAAALASIDYRAGDFATRRIYTAWDSLGDETRLFRGLELLVKNGVKPDHVMVYMLVGHRDTAEGREHRRRRLREFGARPYPMPYVRTRELVGFQRWVIGAYDKRIAWSDWVAANYRPERLVEKNEKEVA